MGISYHSARFLLDAKRNGCEIGQVLTIGRQEMTISPAGLRKLASEFGLDDPPEDLNYDTYAERFLREMLGATQLTCLDASRYEGADIQHDLNNPIPGDLEASFDTVLDGGTLEHVFNVPIAVANYMRLVKPNGQIFIFTPANNYFGHGFYQFSSEFFYRVFSEENGYAVRRLLLSEHDPSVLRTSEAGRRYEAPDPAEVGSRTAFINAMPVEIMLHAQRTAIRSIFSEHPKQSDYSARWKTNDKKGLRKPVGARKDSPLKLLRRMLRRRMKRKARSLRNAKNFPPVS
ncbi:MAG: hypothetical protein QNJ30_01900 [Kiloniellales bacterium]|nr:hypothetical protein [Kiloniellales bacterium]